MKGKIALHRVSDAKTADKSANGRLAKKRQVTRARLLEAAYSVMSRAGVDAAKIKDITDMADIGFGTFYNYFETKDHLADQVLDCIINDLGRRNDLATADLRLTAPELVMPVSIRLVLREAASAPMWQWWALRPDMLVNQMRDGFKPFGIRDIREGMKLGIFHLDDEDVEAAWGLAVWMMVGGIHDIVVGDRSFESESFVVNSIMRILGVPFDISKRIATSSLPKYSKPKIDWNFRLEKFIS